MIRRSRAFVRPEMISSVINSAPVGTRKMAGVLVSQAKPIWEILPTANSLGLPAPALKAIGTFRALIEKYRTRLETEPVVDVVADLVHTIRYQEELARIYKEPNEQIARWNSVEEVVNALGDYQKRAKKPTLSGFLEDTMLGGREEEPDKEKQLNREAVALMTFHSAKGLEFSQVYMVGLEEGMLPHHRSVAAEDDSIDEERRLCYVGITRAQDRLTLSLALNRFKWGKPRPTQPSRFLFEITGKADNPHAKKAIATSTANAKQVKAAASKPAAKKGASSKKPKRQR